MLGCSNALAGFNEEIAVNGFDIAEINLGARLGCNRIDGLAAADQADIAGDAAIIVGQCMQRRDLSCESAYGATAILMVCA
jgi:hypothetical protein